jgi:FlaA1/EpsC-like NDP-sugar epimerase
MRGRHLLVIDVLGILFAAYVALAFRYNAEVAISELWLFGPVLIVLLVTRVVLNVRFGLYSRGWRFASVPELQRITTAVISGSIVAMAIVYLPSVIAPVEWAAGFPRSFWVAELLISLAVLGGVRFGIRAAADWKPQSDHAAMHALRPTLLYGAGRTGAFMATSAFRKPDAGVLPVGFLDDDPTLAGGFVGDLRVFGGLDVLDRAIADTGAEALLITMPSAPAYPAPRAPNRKRPPRWSSRAGPRPSTWSGPPTTTS